MSYCEMPWGIFYVYNKVHRHSVGGYGIGFPLRAADFQFLSVPPTVLIKVMYVKKSSISSRNAVMFLL